MSSMVEPLPDEFNLRVKKKMDFRYGENAHQSDAGLYMTGNNPLALSQLKQVEGGTPSSTNYKDVSRCLQTMVKAAAAYELNTGSVSSMSIGVKHGNACAFGVSSSPTEALQLMLTGGPRPLWGGVVVCNFAVGEDRAKLMRTYGMPEGRKQMFDTIVATDFPGNAVDLLARRSTGKCRLLVNDKLRQIGLDSIDHEMRITQLYGGDFVIEDPSNMVLDLSADYVECYGPEISEQQKRDIILAWAIGSTSNSNTATIVRSGQLLGNGVGQQDRVGAVELAVRRATNPDDGGHDVRGAVLYSDSFFPYPDAVELACEAGVSAIFTSSGSDRGDPETKRVCEEAGVSLVMVHDSIIRGFFGHSG